MTVSQITTRGISLIESVVIVSIFLILMFAVMDSITNFYRINGYTIAQSYQVSFARQGIDVMVRDLREMTFADNGTFPLAVMEPRRVAFYSDIDRDNSVEYVEYKLTGTTTLIKRIFNATGTPITYPTAEGTTTLSEYVQNGLQGVPIFVYYTEDGLPATATTTITDIRYIQTTVIVNVDPIRDPGEYALRSSATLRNLKTTES